VSSLSGRYASGKKNILFARERAKDGRTQNSKEGSSNVFGRGGRFSKEEFDQGGKGKT